MKNKLGVAFSGGGGKGGYQVGVCKALNEFGITPSAVSGTSVGALNGALYAQGRIEIAEQIWLKINRSDVLDLSVDRALLHLAKSAASKLSETNPLTLFCMALTKLKFKRRGLFSQEGLMSMMTKGFADQPLSSLALPFWATVHDRADNKVDHLSTHGRSEDDARNLLLASSSLPGIFDEVSVDEKIYTDGGWFWELPHKNLDNNPVTPLVNAGCTTIILICLSRDDLVERATFPHVRILPILPSGDLGGTFDGIMDFSAEGAAKRIEQGYQDGKKILSRLAQFIECEAEYDKLWQDIQQEEELVKENCQRAKVADTTRVNLKHSIHEFNRIVFDDKLDCELTVDLPNEDKLLEYANCLLIQRLDRQEMLALNDKVKGYVDHNKDCATDLQRAALDAVAYLSPTIPQADALSEQGAFGRLWDGITGKSLKLIAQNQKDLAQAQFAALSLMQQLQSKNIITLQFTAAVNNKLNILFSEVASLGEEMNRTTFDTYCSLSLVWCKARKEIIKDRKRIDALENRLDKLEWLTHIKTKSWLGVHYRKLSPIRQLVCVVNDFYQITKGGWNDRELQTLEAALLKIDLLDKELSYNDFLEESLNDRQNIVRRLTENLYRESLESPEIPLVSTAKTIRTGFGLLALPPTSWDTRLPSFHFALELLDALQRAEYRLHDDKKLGASKSALVERLVLFLTVADQYNCSSVLPEIETLRDQIEGFLFTVPLIGPFSAGKSSLLNRYLEYDQLDELLKTNVTPTTAVATELRWTDGSEKVVERYFDGSQKTYPLFAQRQHVTPPANVFCREIHLNSPILANHPDLVLVDMPGMGSGEPKHDQAIAAYVGRDATAFILCLRQEDGTIKESERRFLSDSNLFDLELGLVINHKNDSDSSTIDDMTSQVSNYSGKSDIEVVALNALDGSMDDFSAMLMRMDAKKDEILRKRFVPSIENVQKRLITHLRYLLNDENLSVEELKRRKEKTEEAIREMEQAFNREQEKLLKDCTSSLPTAVAKKVQYELNRKSLFFIETAKNGGKIDDRIRGLTVATFQAFLAIAARERFAKTAQELQHYVSTVDVADGAGTVSFDAESLPEVSIGLGSIGIGTTIAWIVFGPIGGIIAGIAGFFMRNSQEEELKSKLHGLIEDISQKARVEAARQLPEMAGRFLVALKERLDGILNQQKENIVQLEAQLAENRQQDENKKQEIHESIRTLSITMN